MNDDTAFDLFTEGAHHRNISVVFIKQNLFFQGKQSMTISVNARTLFNFYENLLDRSKSIWATSLSKKIQYLFWSL